MPIIINSNYDNLSQAFMLALNDALTREGITDIIPETAYSVCINLIREWKKDAFKLKMIAIAAMTIDHIAWLLPLNNMAIPYFMHVFGRITAPD